MDRTPTDLRMEIVATRQHLLATARELRERVDDQRLVVRRGIEDRALAIVGGAFLTGFIFGLLGAARRH
jgi:hypothetical protein